MATRTKRAGEDRLIKKYPNRRLYDTQTSSYVTLSDIKGLVMANEVFKVIDAKTMKITDTISTGGNTRLDEMSYDPKDQIFIGVNNAEEPPFATTSQRKPCAGAAPHGKLVEAQWVAAQLAYLKDLDVMQERLRKQKAPEAAGKGEGNEAGARRSSPQRASRGAFR